MRESQFIKQSEKKWKNFEEDLKLDRKNPERTSKLFIQITDDLSYARTYYPNRMVRKYLDGVSQILLSKIYKNQRTPWSQFMNFWMQTLPLEIYRARRAFTVSFLIFALAFGIGVLSSIYEPEFARVILGNSYVDMTISNIENDDPMAVYKDFNALNGFASITMNNIMVAFRTFVFGVLAAIGSVYILLYNGIMVGAFQYFFIQEGLFWESFLTIWQHGTIEISAIIIAGAAGLTLGRGLVFTGSYTRLQSFKISGQRGLMIFLGTVPLFIIAGFIEGFITRDTDASAAVRIAVILVSLLFILFYFGWYPRKVAAQNKEKLTDPIPVEKSVDMAFKKGRIFELPQLVRLSFVSVINKPVLLSLSLVFGIAISYFITSEIFESTLFSSDLFEEDLFMIMWMTADSILSYATLSLFTFISSLMVHSLVSKKKISEVLSIQKLFLAGLIFLPLLHSYFWFLLAMAYPILSLLAANSYGKRIEIPKKILKESMGSAYLLFGFLGLLSAGVFILMALFNTLVLEDVYLILFEDEELRTFISYVVFYLASLSIPILTHLFCTAGFYYFKHSQEETKTAANLHAKIKSLRMNHSLNS